METQINKLAPEELKKLLDRFKSKKFNSDFNLVYEKQIPNVAVLLTNGEVQIYKRNKLLDIVGPGALLGLTQLLQNKALNFTCKIGKDSEVILFDRSTLLEEQKNPESPLCPYLP